MRLAIVSMVGGGDDDGGGGGWRGGELGILGVCMYMRQYVPI